MSLHSSDRSLQVLGEYEILGKIRSRGQRTLYKARQRSTGELVVLKVPPVHLLAGSLLLDQFAEEFLLASAVQHPNLVRCLALEHDESTPYLVFEFVEGESLARRIEREGRVAESEAIRLLSPVTRAVQAIHERGVAHGDIRTSNILIGADGQPKLADLGMVRQDDADLGLPNPRTMLMALNFAAPEQFDDWSKLTPRGDIYSLGAILYVMVTGELPFQASGALGTLRRKLNNEFAPPRKLVPTLSEQTDRAIRRALDVDVTQRPASCLEWIADLGEEQICASFAGKL